MKSMKYLFWLVCISVLATSCGVNSDLMFKTPRGYEFDQAPVDSVDKDYEISPNDILMLRVYTNKGHQLIEMTAGGSGGNANMTRRLGDIQYVVRSDGMLDFPEIGEIEIAGFTLKEAKKMLEERYSQFYNEPYVQIDVMNNRVIVFPGSGGDAMVITLENNNTTVIEALALAGGLSSRGNASKIKLIRRGGLLQEEQIYEMDLSTIQGIEYANMTVQANDILYVQPVPQLASEILRDVAPIVSLFSSLALLYTIINRDF
jgi:polysaccharide export outer membrane protein